MSSIRLTSNNPLVLKNGVFESLLANKTFVDVTLAASTGECLEVHKLILASHSSYFKEILCHLANNNNPLKPHHQHPVIYLKDIGLPELKWLIEFMYTGEVTVPEEEVEGLLAIARQLNITGLDFDEIQNKIDSSSDEEEDQEDDSNSICEEKKEEKYEDPKDIFLHEKKRKSNKKKKRKRSKKIPSDSSEVEEEISIKTEAPNDPLSQQENITEVNYNDLMNLNLMPSTSFQLQLNPVSNFVEQVGLSDGIVVPITTTNNNNINNPPVVEFKCDKCSKGYRSSKSLWRHKKYACEGKHSFVCNICEKVFSRSDNLRRHAVVAHSAV